MPVTGIDASVAVPPLVASHPHHAMIAKWAKGRSLGGATYDALVALAAREHGAVLFTRDARARSTYETFGVSTEVLAVDFPS